MAAMGQACEQPDRRTVSAQINEALPIYSRASCRGKADPIDPVDPVTLQRQARIGPATAWAQLSS
jgi:hypothetical protein